MFFQTSFNLPKTLAALPILCHAFIRSFDVSHMQYMPWRHTVFFTWRWRWQTACAQSAIGWHQWTVIKSEQNGSNGHRHWRTTTSWRASYCSWHRSRHRSDFTQRKVSTTRCLLTNTSTRSRQGNPFPSESTATHPKMDLGRHRQVMSQNAIVATVTLQQSLGNYTKSAELDRTSCNCMGPVGVVTLRQFSPICAVRSLPICYRMFSLRSSPWRHNNRATSMNWFVLTNLSGNCINAARTCYTTVGRTWTSPNVLSATPYQQSGTISVCPNLSFPICLSVSVLSSIASKPNFTVELSYTTTCDHPALTILHIANDCAIQTVYKNNDSNNNPSLTVFIAVIVTVLDKKLPDSRSPTPTPRLLRNFQYLLRST